MMRAVDIIAKKRDGQALDETEIQWFIRAYSNDQLPDYQAAALLMAIVLRGMTIDETTALTLAMAESGETLDLSEIAEYVVDKHSSGGVGDKTSLVVLPLVASCGVPVAKMSGRGLGFSGGTLDKLEAIPGFRADLSEAQFYEQAQRIGLSLAGQSRDLAPADGKLYALRDVTATVPSLPLIASSIMSKKIAAGANGIVLDVKTGSGAFMRTLDDARELAQVMVGIGQQVGRDVVALLSDMNQPLGCAVGNALEVIEAVDTLKGGGPEEFRLHCLEVAAYMLQLAGRGDRWTDLDGVKHDLEQQIGSGAALAKFREMVDAQGGDIHVIDQPGLLPQASLVESIPAPQSGYVARVLAEDIAWAAFDLGAGREKKGDPIDPAVGVVVHKKVGDPVEVGEAVATVYANGSLDSCRERVSRAFAYSSDAVEPLPLFYGVIR